MVSDTFGVWFLSQSQMQRSLSDLIDRTMMWFHPGRPAGWCGPLSSLPQLPAVHGGLWHPGPENACKGSFLKTNQTADKTLGVHISTQWMNGAVVYRLTTRNTCVVVVWKLWLICFLLCWSPLCNWELIGDIFNSDSVLFCARSQNKARLAGKTSCEQAKKEGKTNIIKTWANSCVPNVASRVVPDTLTTWRPCEPAACLKLCWPVNTAC